MKRSLPVFPQLRRLALAPLLALAVACATRPAPPAAPAPAGGAADYAAARVAAAAKDCPTALDRFEAALRADPESLRYGSDYRQTVIACAQYDRAIAFFGQLVTAHPGSAHALLDDGYAHVDKIPTAGSVTQVILANEAITEFTKAVDLEPSWLALYTRGNSYLYWPRILGRTPLAVADLERAVALGQREGKRPYQARAWIALGDAYWKLERLDDARKTWQQALLEFPGNARLVARLGKEGEPLRALIEGELDPNRRVDTDLSVLEER